MAVGPNVFPEMLPIAGFKLGTTSAEIKYSQRKDLVLMAIEPGATISGVFTRNRFCAAPVRICQQHLTKLQGTTSETHYLITNTGYANAGTGPDGYDNSLNVCRSVAQLGAVSVEKVFPFSTGVIGERLPIEKIEAALNRCFDALSDNGWTDAGEGIMTTDTRPKGATRTVVCAGKSVTISGISKGAGMIKPNMATMLAYIATDAGVSQSLLNQLVKEAADLSFNQVTIDGDTSTNDSCMLIATDKAGVQFNKGDEPGFSAFRAALVDVFVELAQAIVKDGEGATKFVTVKVTDARNLSEAREVAYTVAHSPLVKTALFAADPNWGRILAAIGRAPIDDFDVEKVVVYLDSVLLCEKGSVARTYVEAECAKVMAQDEFTIEIKLGTGDVSAEVWTCDFSYDYVKINADYRS
ncbi:MAG: bifunctional glutamate N-acetyltransferase/amino-acid acetyltransferase ArgJ [Pseudomonadales bacterium]|nr:bifunctional glutamate N-acetyltransferase/amino-acid acetyltransferase ArgJ [Pseudomonadales bacterium]